jgi:acyl carrier protein
MSVRLTITEEMTQVAREHRKALAPLKDDLQLAESGLDSLGFAVLVARLEDKLGFDQFTTAWSQNLGHEHILTTFCGYSDVSAYRQAELIRALAERGDQDG